MSKLTIEEHERKQIVDGLQVQKSFFTRNLESLKKNGSSSKEEIEQLEKRLIDIGVQLKEFQDMPLPYPKWDTLATKDRPMIYYSDYLMLNRVLDSQFPLSKVFGTEVHDEMLFIIIHQTYELWFKQILHEVDRTITLLGADFVPASDLSSIVHHLHRVTEIQKVLVEQVNILETMSSIDFMDFRDYLYPASGFQSYQFRLFENRLGTDPDKRILHERQAYHTKLASDHQKLVQESERQLTLFTAIEKWLERFPFFTSKDFDFLQTYKNTVQKMFQKDREVVHRDTEHSTKEGEKSKEEENLSENDERLRAIFDEKFHNEQISDGKRRLSFKATQAAMLIFAYQNEPMLYLPSVLLNTLLDMDENLAAWRFKHALMTQRMIGSRVGTGGSSGYWYLKATLEKGKIFGDISNLSTFLIPRKMLPALPASVKANLGFYHEVITKEEKDKLSQN